MRTFLLLFLLLNTSCVEKKSGDRDVPPSVSVSATSTAGITALFQDRQGRYWFGLRNAGIRMVDGAASVTFTTEDGLLDHQIRSIQEDANGRLLIATAKGLSVFDGGRFTNHPTRRDEPIADWSRSQGEFWVYAGEEDGINRFDGTTLSYLVFPKPDSRRDVGVTDLSFAKDGTLWIATYAALFSTDGRRVEAYGRDRMNLDERDVLHIRSVLADSKGRIWIGNNGIGVLLKDGDTFTNFSETQRLIHPTSQRNGAKSEPGTLEHVFAIEEDRDGNIWFGDRDTGAWRFDGVTVRNIPYHTGFPAPMILTMAKDRKGDLLFGLSDGTVLTYTGERFERRF